MNNLQKSLPKSLPTGLYELPFFLEIKRLKEEIDKIRPIDKTQYGRIMQKLRLDWNYHSNAIEGNKLTYGETIALLMEGNTAKGKPLKDHLDIKGHDDAIEFLLSVVKDKTYQLTEMDIRGLHKMILVNPYRVPTTTPTGVKSSKEIQLGVYKTMPNHVKMVTGATHYYATPEETPAAMRNLITWFRKVSQEKAMHPLAIATYFHHRFVAIHPFDDGNGRMTRILTNLILMQYDYPPIIIKKETKSDYYAALHQADNGEILPFMEFMANQLIHSLTIFLQGAKGESIEEESDIDKEIALLKLSFQGKQKAIKNTKEQIQELIEHTFIPFFENLEKESRKKFGFFFQEQHYFIPTRYTNKNNTISEALLALKENLFKRHFPIDISFQFESEKMKFSKFSRSIAKEIFMNFKEEKYAVALPLTREIIEKSYHETLTQEDQRKIKHGFQKAIIEEIKKQQ